MENKKNICTDSLLFEALHLISSNEYTKEIGIKALHMILDYSNSDSCFMYISLDDSFTLIYTAPTDYIMNDNLASLIKTELTKVTDDASYLPYKKTLLNQVIIPIVNSKNINGILVLNNPKEHLDMLNQICDLVNIIGSKRNEIELIKTLETYSFIDDLTKLKNKNAYNILLKSSKKRLLTNTGIIFNDLNGLKSTNDKYGHQHGDKLLCTLAALLKKHFSIGTNYRISGDEFVTIIENIEKSDFEKLIQEFKNDIEVTSPNLSSIGTHYENNTFNLAQCVFYAEEEMYNQKKLFHQYDTVEINDDNFLSIFLKEMSLDTFTFYIQPVFNCETGNIAYAEALSRRISAKDGKLIQPFEYIPTLKKEHLIVKFEFDFLKQVFSYIHEMNEKHINLIPLKVVLSDQTFLDTNFVSELKALMVKYNISPSSFILSILVLPSDRARQGIYSVISELDEMNIKVFSEGVIGEFDNYEWAMIKGIKGIVFSRSITTRIETSDSAKRLLQEVMNYAQRLGIETVLRGVETNDQLQLLSSFKPNYLQGFLLEKPIPIEQFNTKYLK